jgi:tetratricopeptide (TPR) repeat protein
LSACVQLYDKPRCCMNKAVSALLIALCLVTACNRDPNVAKMKYVENGNRYYNNGKYKEALIMYRNALKRDLRFGEAYYRAALAELKLGRLGEAARDLQRAVELQDKNLDAHTQMANLFLNAYIADKKRGKQLLTELKSISDRFTQRFPKSYDDMRLKGYISLFEGDANKAGEFFAKANSIKPHQQDLVLVYMQTLAMLNRADEGEKLAYEMLAKNPASLPIYDALFLQYMRAKRLPDAERILKSKVENNPKVADPYLQLAAHYYSLKQRPEMMSALQRLSSNQTDFPQGELMVGDFFLRIRDLDAAATHYEEGAKRNPKEKHTYQKRLVEVLVKQNKKDEAQQLVTNILKEDPKDPEAIAIRASLSLLTGTREQLQSAINDLQTVVSRMPDNPVLRYNLGKALLAKGNVQAARVQFDEAIKLRPDYLLPRITLAQIYMQNREYGKVVQMSQEVLGYDANNLPARLLRSRALIGMGEVKQARTELMQTSTQFPDLPEARLQIAALDLQDKNFKSAGDSFRTLYSKFQDPRAFMGIIETTVAQGNPGEATRLLREELAKNPDRLEYRVALANISVGANDLPTAISEYKTVLEKMPRSSDVWLRLGESYRRAGDIGNAMASFKKAQELAPNSVVPYMQLAMLYGNAGQSGQARPMYEQVLKLQPDNPIALNNLAFMIADTGADLDQALTMAQKAKQQRPNDNDVSDTLGWIYVKKNLADSAIVIFRDLVKSNPDRATYRYHYAMALMQKGDKASAKKELEAALRSKPQKDEEGKIRDLMAKIG